MKRTAMLLLLLALVPLSASAQSFSALLTGAAEVPGPGDPDGTGLAVVTINGTTINYTVFYQGIGAPTLAHIHRGAAGTANPPVVDFNVNTLVNGSVAGVSQALIDEIRANPSGFYVNVHTSEFPGGAIRGQLVVTGGGEGTRSSFIPVIGKVTGSNNTNFVTDLRIVNNGGAIATVTLDFFASNPAGLAAPSATQTVTVAPGEQRILNDVVGATLAVTSGLGGLRITSDQNIVASARVINDLRAQNLGTAGFAVDAEEAGETSGTITFLAQNTDYRTNLGYFNSSSTSSTVTLTARSSANGAVLGTNTLTIPGFAMVQQPVFSAISSVSEANRTQNDFYITWTSTAPLFIYGAVTDNKTGDAVFNQ
ncbi:MAG: CHRD domain-containing protein [Acidobacteriota bacterium]|nr:CHRD domain-containing protein [Acidobacteriota bacterium]